jgi:P2 family phage contractile tail tube protein
MQTEQNVAYRVYYQGKDLLGIATLEMPQIQYITETLNGSGIAGEIESPVIGLTQSMTCKMTFTSATPDVFDALDWTVQPLFECYSALQVVDESTGIRDSVPYRVNMISRPKTMPLGSLEQGKKHGNELELELTRLEVLLDGQEKLLIDKLQFMHRVNGTDLLTKVRGQMGLNV